MKNLNVLVQTVLVFVFVAFTSQLSAQESIVASQWQMHQGKGHIPFVVEHHGDIRAYALAEIPAQNDPKWVNQPNGINVNIRNSTVPCKKAVDFTYFQTIVDIPANTKMNLFKINFSNIDDGARVYIFNSRYPNGTYQPGSEFILNKTKKATADFHTKVVAGETNRIVIVQFDDCGSGNTISGVSLEINGKTQAVSKKKVEEVSKKKEEGNSNKNVINRVQGKTLSFQSVNYTSKYIRHQGFQGKITDIKSDIDKKDASFKVVPALDGRSGYISFESVNFPGHYLRHGGFIVRLQKNDGSAIFGKDASFKPVSGLAGKGISFQSSNFPDRYIRHQGFILKLHPSDKSALFNKDTSFEPKPAFIKDNGNAKNTLNTGETLKPGEKLISANNAYMAIMQTDGNFCVYKYVNGKQGGFVWCSMAHGFANGKLIMQTDGNLCVYDSNKRFKWGSYQNKKYALGANYKLVLTGSGKLNVVNASGTVMWTN